MFRNTRDEAVSDVAHRIVEPVTESVGDLGQAIERAAFVLGSALVVAMMIYAVAYLAGIDDD